MYGRKVFKLTFLDLTHSLGWTTKFAYTHAHIHKPGCGASRVRSPSGCFPSMANEVRVMWGILFSGSGVIHRHTHAQTCAHTPSRTCSTHAQHAHMCKCTHTHVHTHAWTHTHVCVMRDWICMP